MLRAGAQDVHLGLSRETGCEAGKASRPDSAASEARRVVAVRGAPRSGGMVLVTFAETKVTRRTGAEPR